MNQNQNKKSTLSKESFDKLKKSRENIVKSQKIVKK